MCRQGHTSERPLGPASVVRRLAVSARKGVIHERVPIHDGS